MCGAQVVSSQYPPPGLTVLAPAEHSDPVHDVILLSRSCLTGPLRRRDVGSQLRQTLRRGYYRRMDTPLKTAREKRKLSVTDLCKRLGTHPQNFYRIERSEQAPKKELARAIYEFFGGEVSYMDIYDPEFAKTLRRRKQR